MDVAPYLARIGAARPTAPTGAALTALHRAHTMSVPFEVYDIHTGVRIVLDLASRYEKIVGRRRGGYCYELNGLFAALLRELGYGVTLVSAFELDDAGHRGPDFEHLRLLVDAVDGRWIADVGNGASWPEPVPLVPGEHDDVRVCHAGELWWTAERRPDGAWRRGWAWEAVPRELADFAERNRYQQYDRESSFRHRRMAVLATEHGRTSLINGVFTVVEGDQRVEREVSPAEEWALLHDRFGIELTRAWAVALSQPA